MDLTNALEQQKERSRAASAVDDAETKVILENSESKFIGYDNTTAEVIIIKYRKVKSKIRTISTCLQSDSILCRKRWSGW